MKWHKRQGTSLSRELFFVAVGALAFSIALFVALSAAGSVYVDEHFNTSEYRTSRDQKLTQSLQEYVDKNAVTSDDWYSLTRWLKHNPDVSITIYKDGLLTFESHAHGTAGYEESADETNAEVPDDSEVTVQKVESESEENRAYQVNFADGLADVIVSGEYIHSYENIVFAIEIIIPCAVFIFILLFAISGKVRYITQLCDEIHIMEGGDLDCPVTIKGRDELALLAVSLESLRKGFIQKLKKIMQLQEDSKALVTEMSHDMRTPMTPLLVYLEMLREKKYTDEASHDSYVEKSYEKAVQLKHMSDNMFSYFLMDKSEKPKLEVRSMKEEFYDSLSGVVDYLTTSGFKTIESLDFADVNIYVNPEYMQRIRDNIVSNLQKYADTSSPISIQLYCENAKVILHFSNMINANADYSKSTGFGVKNIKRMMAQMNSETIVSQKQETYDTFLIFPVVSMQAAPDDADEDADTE